MQTSKNISNQYFVCLKRKKKAIAWNLTEAESTIHPNCTYFGKVFTAMEKHLTRKGLVFYLTWNLDELPSYGNNVVAVVLGDEWCRIPMYTHKVLAVFKCYGTRPYLNINPFLNPSYLNILSWIQFQRTGLGRLPGWLNYVFHKFIRSRKKLQKTTPIYDIPLGYHKQLELPIKDIESRQYDIYFAGSLVHKKYPITSLKHWLKTPKTLSREKLISSMHKIESNFPKFKVKLFLTKSFHSTGQEEIINYSENMMNTKICPVPRGTSLETYRFFEAMRYGCIVVTESLPSRWFYDGSPAIRINDWSELEEVVKKLLSDRQLMHKKHQESLDWWRSKCSETAVGEYIATKLNALI
ncbi:glycosyltransferase family 1 protein [Pleurocapsales cyanobacterium LEGE 10410]|nr:glycosyltransferase family 1 protein [Pleurocapsales cyanobacterium LEGE 10410]